MNYSVVLPCGGKGKRMDLGYNKLFYTLDEQSVIEKTVQVFDQDPKCQQIVIVHAMEEEAQIKALCRSAKCVFTQGGSERYESVYHGLLLVDHEIVLIHDGARPYITQAVIDRVLSELTQYPAVICGVPMKDTVKRVVEGEIIDTPPRSELWCAQTPQGFHTALLKECYEKAIQEKHLITDDASAVEAYSTYKVRMVMGDYANIKITTKEDL
ncbi:MAG: 2-C-methyl-D-erythritol 4-phosphate cytidylyltransferase [Erysipelotrichales bacterium]|nr:2-C-methyl-D-erythritol 4-phosphate cytidylyltransferase [Erysipelotrichales bacterium]